MKTFAAFYFAARGWILAVLFLALLWSRARADAPLRGEVLPVIAAALLLRLWAGAHLGRHGNGAKPAAPALATTGPYAFSRNPLYLSNIAVGTGLVLFANSLSAGLAAALLIALFLHHALLTHWEEKSLRALRGAEYEAYASATPRWFAVRPPEKYARAEEESVSRRAPLREALARQAGNFIYPPAAVALLWAASRWA